MFIQTDNLSFIKSDRIRKWFKDVSINIYGRNRDTYEKQKVIKPLVFPFIHLKKPVECTSLKR